VNKTTKIWLNYIVGGVISIILLWSIYGQVSRQSATLSGAAWKQTGSNIYLVLCIVLMFFNTSLESVRWYLLAQSVEPVKYHKALASYLAGIALSIITPNRIGEYPARILYLGRGNTFGYINVSVLSVMAQLSSVYIFGCMGLVYYNIAFPSLAARLALGACLLSNIFLAVVYWRFEAWLPAFERVKWLRKFAVYGKLLNRMTFRKQFTVLTISLLRFVIFSAQYLFLLRWMNVDIPLAGGFCMAALFFWIMAVIPSIALTELGVRGQVSLYIFRHFSANTIGILSATTGIWMLNLIIPSIAGSILILRMKILR
jgi:hypothetical protein